MLLRCVEAVLANMLDPGSMMIFLQFVSIGAALPETGKQTYLSEPGVLYRRLADYLSAGTRNGRLRIDDTDRTARIFVEMLKAARANDERDHL
jgi:hypothetical protein